ncbi:MAG: class I SAM-dependent methyltransferase [candidate division Zixibacteria bacterium]|nr:class I SAM-dependent methyltransferase [candidate division Zixibacteria bacterium]
MENKEYYKLLQENRKFDDIQFGSRVWEATRVLKKGENFLDVGCGTGTLLYQAKRYYSGVYGLDIAISKALKSQNGQFELLEVDVDKTGLPFEDNFFDTISALDVIEHVFDPVFLLEETYRVLKKGEQVIYTTPNVRALRHLSALVFKGKFPGTSNEKIGYDGGHLHYFTHRDSKELFKRTGFSEVRTSGLMTLDGRFAPLKKLFRKGLNRSVIKEFLSPGIVIKARK